MIDLTVRQLEYLLAVLDHGSVSAGAAAVHVSQASVSAGLAQLERTLGVTLLTRGPARRARATAAGEEFAAGARGMLSSLREAMELAAMDRAELRGPLSVGCAGTISPKVIPGLVEHVSQWPQVQLSIVEGTPPALQERVANGSLDIAVVYERQLSHDLATHHLYDVRLHAMLPAGHPLARDPEVALRDLVSMPAILLDVPPTAEVLVERIRALGLEPDVRWRSSNPETIRSLVARGQGFSLVNAVPAAPTLSFEGLEVVHRPLSDEQLPNPALAVTAKGRLPRRVAEAIEVLRAAATETAAPPY